MLNNYTAPPGADYGNYLTQVNILNGNDLRGWGLRHQPLYFVLLDGLTGVFDAFTALKVGAALVFSIIVFPFFFLAKKLAGDNNITAAIATGLFAFFISNSEMITWGGNPNFLAFSFLLLALFFIVDLADKPSKKSIICAGFFLSLVIGTHILVAIFTFGVLSLFALLRFIFIEKRKDQIKSNIKIIIYLLLTVIIFSLPYVSFYLTFLKNSAGEMAGFRLIEIQFGAISFTDTWILISKFITVLAIGLTGTYWLIFKYLKENKPNALLLLSVFITPLTLFLITSQPLRWLYFLPIPFLLCFSIYLKKLSTDVKQVKKITISLFTVLFTIAIVMQGLTLAGEHLSEAAEFYQFAGENEIKALNWIKVNTAPDAVFATSGHSNNVGGGGNSYAWWVEGYANRICMFTGDLEFYSFQFERNEVKTTNRIFAGTYVIDNGKIEIADSFPTGVDNPQILALIEGEYEKMFTINDAQNQVYYSPTDDEQNMTIAWGYAENGISSVNYDNSTATITITYEQNGFDLTRSLILHKGESYVDVVYQITPKNTTLKEFRINVWSSFETSLQDCNINKDSVATITQGPSGVADSQIQVVETSGKLVGASVIFQGPIENSRPVVNYVLEPEQNDLYAHLRVTINTPVSETDNNREINFYDAYTQLKDLDVDYILLNKYRTEEYQRFLADSSHFKVEYQNAVVIIFKVIY